MTVITATPAPRTTEDRAAMLRVAEQEEAAKRSLPPYPPKWAVTNARMFRDLGASPQFLRDHDLPEIADAMEMAELETRDGTP